MQSTGSIQQQSSSSSSSSSGANGGSGGSGEGEDGGDASCPGPSSSSSSASTSTTTSQPTPEDAGAGETSTAEAPQSESMRPITKSPAFKGTPPPMPECWGHRGASGAFPENTIASFERAVKDGSEGIESDVHITADDMIVMFHDPSLERTTDGKGLIREQNYHGGIEKVRTTKEPIQKIPTFEELCDLLMREECKHVKANIDIKPDNDPERLFRLMKQTVSKYPNYETDLSPRLILGLWHPKFLHAAIQHVPTLRRIHIGAAPSIARQYFWNDCDGFSMYFASLVTAEGQSFIRDAQKAGKDVFVWTVNRPDEMIEATRWGVKAVLTDNTGLFRDLRIEMAKDFAATRRTQVGVFFRWADWRYWTLPQYVLRTMWLASLEKRAGETFKDAEIRGRKEASLLATAAAAAAAAEAAEAAALAEKTTAETAASPQPPPPATQDVEPPPAAAAEEEDSIGSGTTTAVGTPETFNKGTQQDGIVPPMAASISV